MLSYVLVLGCFECELKPIHVNALGARLNHEGLLKGKALVILLFPPYCCCLRSVGNLH